MTCSMKARLVNMQEELDSMSGEQLRQARLMLRLTQTELALEVGVKLYRDWETIPEIGRAHV